MRDIFYEETVEIVKRDSAKRKYNIFNFLSVLSYVACVLCLIILTFIPLGGISFFLIGVLPFIIFFIGGILLGFARDSFYVEYDYRFLSGEVIISRVIKAKKRKKGFSFRCVDLERFGVYNSETYKKYQAMPNVYKSIMTSNIYPEKNKDFYYVVYNDKDKKRLIIIECTKQFVKYMMSFCNKFIFDEELKNL